MDKLNTMLYRKHPGGLRGFISTYRIIFPISLTIAGIMMIVSFCMMLSGDCKVSVVGRRGAPEVTSFGGTGILTGRSAGLFTFTPRNLIDRLLISETPWTPAFVNSIFNFLIVFYLYRIFKLLNLDAPFSIQIASYIKKIGIFWIISFIINELALLYTLFTIKTLSHGEYLPARQAGFAPGLFAGIVILIIAEVYRRGCKLQEEKDLTI